MNILFQNILFTKEFLECLDYKLGIILKLNRGLGLVPLNLETFLYTMLFQLTKFQYWPSLLLKILRNLGFGIPVKIHDDIIYLRIYLQLASNSAMAERGEKSGSRKYKHLKILRGEITFMVTLKAFLGVSFWSNIWSQYIKQIYKASPKIITKKDTFLKRFYGIKFLLMIRERGQSVKIGCTFSPDKDLNI